MWTCSELLLGIKHPQILHPILATCHMPHVHVYLCISLGNVGAHNANGRRDEPTASDPIFAPINKFNVQTPGMRENIKNENYILPRSCHIYTYIHICYIYVFIHVHANLPPLVCLSVCALHICINIIMKRKFKIAFEKKTESKAIFMCKLKLLC